MAVRVPRKAVRCLRSGTVGNFQLWLPVLRWGLGTTDEHIVEMIVWSDADRVYGVQFITNMGRVSPHFGGEDKGVPTVAKSNGGILNGFSSIVRWDNDKKDFLLVQLEVSKLCSWMKSRLRVIFRECGATMSWITGWRRRIPSRSISDLPPGPLSTIGH